MDFTITDEQRALAEATKGVLARHGSPAAESGGSARPQDHDARLWAALVELGVPALPWSEADGGLGGAWSDLALAATEVGRARLGVPLAETAVAGHLVARLADDALRAELLGALSEGSMLVVPALDEPGRSFDPIPHDVVAEETPEGWRLTGTKAPVRYAQAADRAVVTAVTPVGTGVFVVEVGDRESDSLVLEAAPATLLATGETRSVREFVELAFAEVGRSIEWRGKDVEETGIDAKSGKVMVKIDPTYFRPTEVDLLIGDASKARAQLGWTPKTPFGQLVKEMVASDLVEARQDAANGKHGV